MIHSDKQRRISTREVRRLKEALSAAASRESEQRWLRDVGMDAMRSEITRAGGGHCRLRHAQGQARSASRNRLLSRACPRYLCELRIAAGMSQTSLAEALKMKPQQIQRYEASEYQGASLARLIEVSKVLGVHTEGLFWSEQASHGGVFSWEKADEIEWRRFPIREMVKRGWFSVTAREDSVQAVKAYFRSAAGPQFATAFPPKEKSAAIRHPMNTLFWRGRHACSSAPSNGLRVRGCRSSGWTIAGLESSWALTRRGDGPREAAGVLAKNGIVLLTERQLTGTYLDGAAMLEHNGRPVIGLTLRFDRLDNFWFVLFHELGHIFLQPYGELALRLL